MFDFRNGRSSPKDPGNGVVGFSNRSRVPMSKAVKDPKKEALGKSIAKWIHIYAWFVHAVPIPIYLLGGVLGVFGQQSGPLDWWLVVIGWLVLAGLPIVLVGRVVANKLTLYDDARSYDAVRVYFVGIAIYVLLWTFLDIVS